MVQTRRHIPLFLVYSPCWLIYGAFVVSGISLLGARHFPEEVGMRGEGKSWAQDRRAVLRGGSPEPDAPAPTTATCAAWARLLQSPQLELSLTLPMQAPCSVRKRRNAPRSRPHRTSSTVCTPPLTLKKASSWASPHNGRTSWTHFGGPSLWWTLHASHGCSSSP